MLDRAALGLAIAVAAAVKNQGGYISDAIHPCNASHMGIGLCASKHIVAPESARREVALIRIPFDYAAFTAPISFTNQNQTTVATRPATRVE